METLYYSKLITKGKSKGCIVHTQKSFATMDDLMVWLKAISNSKTIGYKIVDKSFQTYQR